MEIILILAIVAGFTYFAVSKRKPSIGSNTNQNTGGDGTNNQNNNNTNNTQPKKTLKDAVSEVFFNSRPPATCEPVSNAIEKWSTTFNLDRCWVAAIAMMESTYGVNTVNPNSSAAGVMQITKDTVTTINNIIKARYPAYITYATHTHEELKTNIDSNVMHACVYLRYIIDNKIKEKYKPLVENADVYKIAVYLYHYGANTTITAQTLSEAVETVSFSAYVEKVYEYYTKLCSKLQG